MEIGSPFTVDGRGHLSDPDYDDHIYQLIEQVLFTSPGQRVNRPDFGAGLLEAVFASQSAELLSAVELAVQGSLERWLGQLVDVESVRVDSSGGRMTVTVVYTVRKNQQRRTALFEPTRLPWLR
jgi:hypothetical protein